MKLADASRLFATTTREPAQSTTAVPAHTPAVHTSPLVQPLPPSQASPSLAGCARQEPAASLQTPVLHASVNDEQSRGNPPPHPPPVHVWPTVQKALQSASVTQGVWAHTADA